MCKRVDDMQELEHRSRPAMAEDERRRLGARSFLAIEMDVEAARIAGELWKPVQLRFPFAPVIFVHPIGAEPLHEIEIGAIGPRTVEPGAARRLLPFVCEHAFA